MPALSRCNGSCTNLDLARAGVAVTGCAPVTGRIETRRHVWRNCTDRCRCTRSTAAKPAGNGAFTGNGDALMSCRYRSLLWFCARYGYVPFLLLGINGVAVICIAQNGLQLWQIALLLILAIGIARLAEHILPYEPEWNVSHDDTGKDVTHGFVYELSGMAGLV